MSLPGATIQLTSQNFSKGTVSNDKGGFNISNVPVGRYSIEARFIGYEPFGMAEILVTSVRPVILEFRLQEMVSEIESVEVISQVRKDIPLNHMATLSARTFTVEESRRYAGGFDDPGRMAASFAGVAGGSPNDNAMSIRGNAPKGLAWRVEGVSVPNPNHFAGMLAEGGGIVSLLSAQLLTNSDFYTGAFPAEYGNALSGVFDMNLRTGNNEKRGWGIQIGTLGADVFGEGPFVNGKNSSYLFNYRYATTAILKDLIPEGQLPVYQDLSFKLHLPAGKAGIFSVWALGGIDLNGSDPLADSSQWNSSWDRTRYTWKGKTIMGGLNHRIILQGTTEIKTSLTAALNQFSDRRELMVQGTGFIEYEYFQNFTSMLSIRSVMTHRFNRKLSNRSGLVISRIAYDIQARASDPDEPGMPVIHDNAGDGLTGYIQGFSQFRWSLHNKLSLTGGVNSMLFFLNRSLTLEPRLGIDYRFQNGNRISAAYGNHGQIEPLPAYFYRTETVPGIIDKPNLSLSPTRSHHYVMSYKRLLFSELLLNIETYFQRLYNVPVSPEGNYSMINFKKEYLVTDSLINDGMGSNLGIDITLEKYLKKNYYFLITGSLFDSRYTAADGQTYNTRWDYGFVTNFLGGREFFLGKDKTKILGINARFVYQGGERTHPVDEHVFNPETGLVEVRGEGFIFPNISYKIEF